MLNEVFSHRFVIVREFLIVVFDELILLLIEQFDFVMFHND